jgi:hypothetical protein
MVGQGVFTDGRYERKDDEGANYKEDSCENNRFGPNFSIANHVGFLSSTHEKDGLTRLMSRIDSFENRLIKIQPPLGIGDANPTEYAVVHWINGKCNLRASSIQEMPGIGTTCDENFESET